MRSFNRICSNVNNSKMFGLCLLGCCTCSKKTAKCGGDNLLGRADNIMKSKDLTTEWGTINLDDQTHSM